MWYRNDLRLKDNETLARAIQQANEVIAVYCFDPRLFQKTELGFPKTGSFRAKFLQESVADLRQSFQKIGSDLIILQGKPEEVVVEFAKKLKQKLFSFLKR